MTADLIRLATSSRIRVFDLGRLLYTGMPQSPNHPRYTHTLFRRHGDVVRDDGTSAASDLLVTGTHVGTHIDAFAHYSAGGLLHGGADADLAGRGGVFLDHGVHTIPPIIARGVLLDIPRLLGVDRCDDGYEITSADLAAASGSGSQVRPGDVVFVRSGWGQLFDGDPDRFLGRDAGVPGVGAGGAQWLAEQQILAVGADTVAFERLEPGAGHSSLPAHRVLLVDAGVYIIECVALEELAAARIAEFLCVIVPLDCSARPGRPCGPWRW